MKEIYTPYTYRILFIPTGQEYYGVQFKQGPKNLWVSYFTSSKVIKKLIQEHGKDAFEIVSIEIHTTKEEALIAEEAFLVSVDAGRSEHWLNRCNGWKNFCFMDTPEAKEAHSERVKTHYAENPEALEVLSKAKKVYYAGHPEALEAMSEKAKTRFAEHPEAREAHSERMKATMGTPEARKAMSEIKKTYLAEHPEALKAMSERAVKQWATSEAREAQSKRKKAYYAENTPPSGADSPLALTYKIFYPDGVIEIIKGLKEFCKEYGLDDSSMIKVAKGRDKQHKGFRCEYYTQPIC